MASQIQIRWDSTDAGRDYETSLAALATYSPLPTITSSVRMKGTLPKAALDKIVAVAEEHGLDVNLTLTAVWAENEEPQQMRLFASPNNMVQPTIEIAGITG